MKRRLRKIGEIDNGETAAGKNRIAPTLEIGGLLRLPSSVIPNH
jgi:hypothetical protein